MTGSDIEMAWAAGIFEGEGSIIHFTGRNGQGQRRLSVKMTDEDIILRLVTATGCGAVTGPRQRRADWKPIWGWNVCRWVEIEYVLTAFRPLLGERRGAKADELLADPALMVGRPLRDTCVAGHPRTDETVYIHPKSGVWHCRVCSRERAEAKRRAEGKPRRPRRPDQPNPLRPCECGCGQMIPSFGRNWRPRRFVTGHNIQPRQAVTS